MKHRPFTRAGLKTPATQTYRTTADDLRPFTSPAVDALYKKKLIKETKVNQNFLESTLHGENDTFLAHHNINLYNPKSYVLAGFSRPQTTLYPSSTAKMYEASSNTLHHIHFPALEYTYHHPELDIGASTYDRSKSYRVEYLHALYMHIIETCKVKKLMRESNSMGSSHSASYRRSYKVLNVPADQLHFKPLDPVKSAGAVLRRALTSRKRTGIYIPLEHRDMLKNMNGLTRNEVEKVQA